MAGPRSHSKLILPMLYGLNNSFGKTILIGLNGSSYLSDDFQPMIHICGYDFYGMNLSVDAWDKFKEQFAEIDRFFNARNEEELLDHRIDIPGYRIRFMITFSDRAFELTEQTEEERGESDEPPTKRRYKHSMVFKRVTFDRLKSLTKLIDYRIQYLLKIKKGIRYMLDEIKDYVKQKLQNNDDTDLKFMYFTASKVMYAMKNFDEQIISNIDDTFKKNSINVAIEDIYVLLYDILNLHLYSVISYLNANIQDE